MKKYKSHKIVEASKIQEIAHVKGSNRTPKYDVLLEGGDLIEVHAEVFDRHASESELNRLIGGYLVRYEDGYSSWSPAKVFEDGYAEVDVLTFENTTERIARTCHEVNRAFCAAFGDDSQLAWEDAPQWQRDSALNGVTAHLQGNLSPEQSHESWMKQKMDEGWEWGPVKDPARKQHPCIVPYRDLPTEQKAKDYLFKAVVESLAGE